MKQISRSYLLIAAVLTVITDAQVSLESLDELQNSFICGENQILKCTIESYTNIMTWTKDTYRDPLASCTASTCSVNPSMSANYNFTFDTVNGIFYMEILTVKVADNDTAYSCANGFVFATVTSNVNVEDNYSIFKNSESINSDTTKVSCTTGCIKNKTLEAVQFKWWFQEVNNTDSEKIKINESEPNTNYDSSVCMNNPNCGVLGYSYATNVINITNEENGKNYSLGVDITSGGNLIKTVYYDLIFTRNYTEAPNQPPSNTTDIQTQNSDYSNNIIPIVIGSSIGGILICVLLVLLVFFCCRKYQRFLKARKLKSTRTLPNLEYKDNMHRVKDLP